VVMASGCVVWTLGVTAQLVVMIADLFTSSINRRTSRWLDRKTRLCGRSAVRVFVRGGCVMTNGEERSRL
jgi:hypothetical protein